jgi:hypothetical protein
MRTVLHCAPLKTQGYTSQFSDVRVNYTRYWYGVGWDAQGKRNHTNLRWMYEAEDIPNQYRDDYVGAANYLLT